ncbi:MAG: hypothetical protein KBT87_14740 [Gammaproteobacteria bacterium]|nr:hypothetical protein [Gammaproteobacteria bacterium]
MSFNLYYDDEIEVNEVPTEGFATMENFLQESINDVIGNYSVETWKKYSKANEEKPHYNYHLVVKSYKESFGSTEECEVATPIYIKRYNLFRPNESFWRWESECIFEKTTGTAVVDFSFTNNSWGLLSWGIQ